MNVTYPSQRKKKTLLDSYRHKGMRMQLVEVLKKRGISDAKVLKAIAEIPRHFFLDKAFEEWAYKDVPFPIESNQTISQPYTVAFQSSLLNIKKGEKILEVGTGSGYQASVLSHMGAKVYSIERQKKLHQITSQFPGASYVPDALIHQLRIGGVLVIPVGDKIQKMLRITKISANQVESEDFGDFRFVPFLKGVTGS